LYFRFGIVDITSQGGGLVWLNFPTAYSFVMISPNLHAIWVFLFLNLSQDLKLVLLIYFGTLGDGYSLKGSNKKPSRHKYPDTKK
jgi:hypothetical protein